MDSISSNEALFLCPFPRASRNVLFVFSRVAACFEKSQTFLVASGTPHNMGQFHVLLSPATRGIKCLGLPLSCFASYPLCGRSYKAPVFE